MAFILKFSKSSCSGGLPGESPEFSAESIRARVYESIPRAKVCAPPWCPPPPPQCDPPSPSLPAYRTLYPICTWYSASGRGRYTTPTESSLIHSPPLVISRGGCPRSVLARHRPRPHTSNLPPAAAFTHAQASRFPRSMLGDVSGGRTAVDHENGGAPSLLLCGVGRVYTPAPRNCFPATLGRVRAGQKGDGIDRSGHVCLRG